LGGADATKALSMTSNDYRPPRAPSVPEPPAEVIARAVAGDTAAFGAIVVRYQQLVFSVAYLVLGDVAEAEDAAQEAFLRLYRALPRYRAEAAFGTWVFRLAVTAALDHRRRLVRRPAVPHAEVPLAVAGEAGAEQLAEARELLAAIARLSPALRAPLVLRAVYGYEYAEIAALLGKPVGTVKAAVHRARQVLMAAQDTRAKGEQKG
jgi:RNA polymerase sigma-70 factor (ECF subfamily)